ncbi:39S ribosomal protein L16, mitochondrial [Tetranychus urticae]|uniref:Large ribosomal subunit protein uL16m n=1 Tax=Tetranychus urticae TaxID=32264 RepID=T1K9G9_TETUR|nr:39S ribosomal protein L16, mitochondrial [Tetranychus urticae]
MALSIVKSVPAISNICFHSPINCIFVRNATGLINSFYRAPKERVKVPPSFDHVILPDPEHRKLPALESVPLPPNGRDEMKTARRIYDAKGPETIHNRLLHGQYGLMALSGGHLYPPHIKIIRDSVNRHVKGDRFAVWRIDPPWKTVTRKSPGKKLGGGKGSIFCYSTPIRTGRIIFEFGGKCEFEDILKMLLGVAKRLPLDALPVYAEFFNEFQAELKERERNNLNPLTIEHAVKNNLADCRKYMTAFELFTNGKYR